MTHLDLFSGIGGFALAAQTVWGSDYHCVGFCEIDPFCQQVLRKNFKGVRIYGDIRGLTAERLAADAESGQSGEQTEPQGRQDIGRGSCTAERLAADADRSGSNPFRVETDGNGTATNAEWRGQPQSEFGRHISIDLLTGGFPCQPFSTAGKRKGTEDDRFLWPEMLRVIREVKPRWVIGENVAGIIEMALGQVCAELESLDYEVQCFVIPACAVNAPHRRDRVWIVANRIGAGAGGDDREVGDEGRGTSEDWGTSLRQGDGQTGSSGVDATIADASSNPRCNAEGGAYREDGGERVGRRVDQDISERNEMGGNPSDDRSEPSSDTSDLLRDGGNGDERECERCQEVPQLGNSNGDCPSSDTESAGHERREPERNLRSGGRDPEYAFPDWSRDWREVAFESCVRGVDDGLPKRMVRLPDGTSISESKWRQEALKCYGNSIVPEVAMEIMKAIKAVIEAKSLDVSMYCTPEPGKEVLAVSIHKITKEP